MPRYICKNYSPRMKKLIAPALLMTVFVLQLSILLISCNNDANGNANGNTEPTTNALAPKTLSFSLVKAYNHDTSSFTEGLLFYNGDLYESTGMRGKSRIMKTDLATGKILQHTDLDSNYFGEGIVILNDTIYQLTYQEKIGFMYSAKDFKKIGEFKFSSEEGWGMTTDGKQIIASDGTSTLYFYEPGSFRLLRTQVITEGGNLSFNVNELEYVDGFIYANQWQSPYILKIDPATGYVVAKADLSSLTNRIKTTYPYAAELNGIAYNPATKNMYVTGKYWPELYEIKFSQ